MSCGRKFSASVVNAATANRNSSGRYTCAARRRRVTWLQLGGARPVPWRTRPRAGTPPQRVPPASGAPGQSGRPSAPPLPPVCGRRPARAGARPASPCRTAQDSSSSRRCPGQPERPGEDCRRAGASGARPRSLRLCQLQHSPRSQGGIADAAPLLPEAAGELDRAGVRGMRRVALTAAFPDRRLDGTSPGNWRAVRPAGCAGGLVRQGRRGRAPRAGCRTRSTSPRRPAPEKAAAAP